MKTYILTYLELPLLLFDNSPIIMFSFFFALIIIYCQKNKNNKLYSFFFPQVIIYILLTFFPLLVIGMKKLFISDTAAYARMNWLYMVIPAIAIGVVIIWEQMKGREKVVFAILLLFLLFLVRSDIFPEKKQAQNIYYKILENVRIIDDKIMEDNKAYLEQNRLNHVTSVFLYSDNSDEEYDKYRNFNLQTRAYASPIEVYAENTDIYTEDFSEEIFINCNNHYYDYVVSSNKNTYEPYILTNGYSLILENNDYKLYYRNK